jgi:hypothetical protein
LCVAAAELSSSMVCLVGIMEELDTSLVVVPIYEFDRLHGDAYEHTNTSSVGISSEFKLQTKGR